jgi:hypothetical protein
MAGASPAANQILLDNYYLPGQLEARLAEFVDYYNTRVSRPATQKSCTKYAVF